MNYPNRLLNLVYYGVIGIVFGALIAILLYCIMKVKIF